VIRASVDDGKKLLQSIKQVPLSIKQPLTTIFDESEYWNIKKAPHEQLAVHEKDRQ